jgi:hypothetical protein
VEGCHGAQSTCIRSSDDAAMTSLLSPLPYFDLAVLISVGLLRVKSSFTSIFMPEML